MDKQTPRQPATCPHLGIADDPSTSHNYPSFWNYCFHAEPPASPHFHHQETTCLTRDYTSCPVFQAAQGAPFPGELRNKTRPPAVAEPPQKSNRIYFFIAGAVLILALAGGLAGRMFMTQSAKATATPPSSNVPVLTGENTATAPAATASPTQPKMTPTSVDPATPTSWVPTPDGNSTPAPYTLEILFKIGEEEFLIHQVKAGEGLDYLAKIHNTTIDAILATNYSVSTPIWTDSFIIIRPGITFVDIFEPSFQPYQVIDSTITLEELAERLDADLAGLKYYNGCIDVCTFVRGDWLLVARPK